MSAVYILHKIHFFPLLQIFFFIFSPLLVFFSKEGDKREKYFQNSLFYSYYPHYHIVFQFFFTKEWRKCKKMLSVLLIFTFFFSLNHIFFYFFTPPPSPLAGSNLQNIHPLRGMQNPFSLSENILFII